ncbi:MAG: hypothetical protein ACLFR7_08805 [Opitutales bacterium]
MVIKAVLLRLSQILFASIAIYLLLIAGTFFLQVRFEDAIQFASYSGGVALLWAIATFFIWRSPAELVREVAIVVYPGGALASLALAVAMGYWMESMLVDPEREIWTLIMAGVMIAIVMIIRCFDIQWLRSAEELQPPRRRPDLDDEYGPLR